MTNIFAFVGYITSETENRKGKKRKMQFFATVTRHEFFMNRDMLNSFGHMSLPLKSGSSIRAILQCAFLIGILSFSSSLFVKLVYRHF